MRASSISEVDKRIVSRYMSPGVFFFGKKEEWIEEVGGGPVGGEITHLFSGQGISPRLSEWNS